MRKVLLTKAMAKTVSWLVISGLIIAAPTWYETGSVGTAFLVAFWACLFKTPVYWLHELGWQRAKPAKGLQPVAVARRVHAARQLCHSSR